MLDEPLARGLTEDFLGPIHLAGGHRERAMVDRAEAACMPVDRYNRLQHRSRGRCSGKGWRAGRRQARTGRSQVRLRLSGGGRRIRTLGSP
jgi:hypothetical protein